MSFQQGLSGLNVSSKALDAIGNNIANSGTAGFKSAAARFADVYAASLAGAGASQIGIGANVATVFQQFTQGNVTSTNSPLDLALNGGGFFRLSDATGAATGVASFTRNGQFQVNKDGYIVNSAGLYLTGILADPATGIVPSSGQPAALQLDTSLIQPNATTESDVEMNFDSRDTPPTGGATAGSVTGSAVPGTLVIAAGNNTLTLTIDGVGPVNVDITAGTYASAGALATAVESLINADATFSASGVAVDVTLDSSGQVVITSRSVGTVGSQGSGSTIALGGGDGEANLLGGAPVIVAGTDTFSATNPLSYTASTSQTVYDSLGNPHNLSLFMVKTSQANTWQFYTSLDAGTPVGPSTLAFDSSGALTTAMPIAQSFTIGTGAVSPLAFTLDLTGTTQYGSSFGVNALAQDGFTSGRLSGISVADDGTIQGQYSNGRTRDMGRLVLASFPNPNGLQNIGGNLWRETADSGQPIEGTAGQGSLGVIQSAAVEESNVDLTAELVNMITQQRSYQANAQTIKTQDQILQTLVNLR